MKSPRLSNAGWRYAWLTYRRDALWFPPAFLVLFLAILGIMGQPGIRFALARAYLGFLLPLVGGILAAYALLGDPAFELKAATPERAERTLAARLGLILSIQALSAGILQLAAGVLGVDFSPLGGTLPLQAMWLVPTLFLIALGTAGALAGAQPATGAFLVGGTWLVELLMKRWFEANARPLFLFHGVFSPNAPSLVANRFALTIVAAALLVLSCVLWRRKERYL